MQTLKNLREQANLSVKKTAEYLNVSQNAIYNYESGIRQINIQQVLKLSQLFDVTAEEIIQAQLNSHQKDQ